ncbi:hypothetical protein CN918_28975 [Priestia megaterium]|nr:hypothetical protein CN918_28975 [Priestia megaterium]
MKKIEIDAMSKEDLFLYILNMESRLTNEMNYKGKFTKKSIKEFKWAIERAVKILGFDVEKIKSSSQLDFLWDE